MNATKLRDIAVEDANGNLHTVEQWYEMRFVNQLGKQVPTPQTWFVCNGIEVNQVGTAFQGTQGVFESVE